MDSPLLLGATVSSVLDYFRWLKGRNEKQNETEVSLTFWQDCLFTARAHFVTHVRGWQNAYRKRMTMVLLIGKEMTTTGTFHSFHNLFVLKLSCLAPRETCKCNLLAGNSHSKIECPVFSCLVVVRAVCNQASYEFSPVRSRSDGSTFILITATQR